MQKTYIYMLYSEDKGIRWLSTHPRWCAVQLWWGQQCPSRSRRCGWSCQSGWCPWESVLWLEWSQASSPHRALSVSGSSNHSAPGSQCHLLPLLPHWENKMHRLLFIFAINKSPLNIYSFSRINFVTLFVNDLPKIEKRSSIFATERSKLKQKKKMYQHKHTHTHTQHSMIHAPCMHTRTRVHTYSNIHTHTTLLTELTSHNHLCWGESCLVLLAHCEESLKIKNK